MDDPAPDADPWANHVLCQHGSVGTDESSRKRIAEEVRSVIRTWHVCRGLIVCRRRCCCKASSPSGKRCDATPNTAKSAQMSSQLPGPTAGRRRLKPRWKRWVLTVAFPSYRANWSADEAKGSLRRRGDHRRSHEQPPRRPARPHPFFLPPCVVQLAAQTDFARLSAPGDTRLCSLHLHARYVERRPEYAWRSTRRDCFHQAGRFRRTS